MSVQQAALERYAVQLRRERLRYWLAVGVIVVAASVFAAEVWLHGEISHVTLHTVAKPPADIQLGTPTTVQAKLWSTTDSPASGTPYSGGSVVTYDQHTVRGRDARTGVQTWSYTRTDRTVCAVEQVQGVTVAVYKLDGNCDEVTALDSGTGQRRWTRTLDMDAHPLNGAPQFSISGTTVMVVSPSVIYAISTTSGYDAWLFAEAGCTVQRAVLGSSGALISQDCAHRDCTGVKFCRNGQQLLLRDPTTGENTDSSKNNGNPDQIFWDIASDKIPASAGAVISAFDPTGASLTMFDNKAGKVTGTVPLQPSNGAPLGQSTDTGLSDADLVWSGGVTYALGATDTHLLWSLASDAAPTVTSDAYGLPATLTTAHVVAPGTHGVDVLNTGTGMPSATYSVDPTPPGSALVYPLGTGFLVEAAGVTVYG